MLNLSSYIRSCFVPRKVETNVDVFVFFCFCRFTHSIFVHAIVYVMLWQEVQSQFTPPWSLFVIQHCCSWNTPPNRKVLPSCQPNFAQAWRGHVMASTLISTLICRFVAREGHVALEQGNKTNILWPIYILPMTVRFTWKFKTDAFCIRF